MLLDVGTWNHEFFLKYGIVQVDSLGFFLGGSEFSGILKRGMLVADRRVQRKRWAAAGPGKQWLHDIAHVDGIRRKFTPENCVNELLAGNY